MKEFRDRENKIFIRNEQGSTLELPRPSFIELEPGYRIPPAGFVRLYSKGYHTFLGEDTQTVAQDLSTAVLDGYIEKLRQYRASYHSGKPLEEPPAIDPIWTGENGLENNLRKTIAWSKLFALMTGHNAMNAAGTLVLLSITTTHNLEDLVSGWTAITGLIQTLHIEGFTEDELQVITKALTRANFPLDRFDLSQ